MKRVKPTRCYTMVYWNLWIAQHVSGITMPVIRSSRLYRWSQRMAPHLGYGRLLVWCMAVGFWSVRLEGFIRSNKPLCSIELVLLSSCHRRCTLKHSSNSIGSIVNVKISTAKTKGMTFKGILPARTKTSIDVEDDNGDDDNIHNNNANNSFH